MICRKYFLVLPLVLICFLFGYPPSIAADGGYSGYKNHAADFSGLNADVIRKQGDEYFVKAYDSEVDADKKKFYRLAMNKYYVLSQIYPGDYYAYAQMARINDERAEDRFAKKNFSQAFNLDKYNPYTNFYYAEYNIKRERYHEALKYYLTAYNNGYKDNYITNFKIAVLYEKLGDLKKSKEFYENSYKLNPEANDLRDKINSIQSLNYEQTEYYHSIRE